MRSKGRKHRYRGVSGLIEKVTPTVLNKFISGWKWLDKQRFQHYIYGGEFHQHEPKQEMEQLLKIELKNYFVWREKSIFEQDSIQVKTPNFFDRDNPTTRKMRRYYGAFSRVDCQAIGVAYLDHAVGMRLFYCPRFPPI